MVINRFLYITFFIFYCCSVFSQENMRHFTVDDGLPSNNINSMTQDHIGYLWIATDKGIVKFDGSIFEEISTDKTYKIDFANQSIFATTNNHIFIKNHSTSILKTDTVLKIISFHKNIFLATKSGISIIKENSIIPLKVHPQVDSAEIYDVILINDWYYLATSNGFWKIDQFQNPSLVKKINETVFIALEVFEANVIASTPNDGVSIFKEDELIENISTIQGITDIKRIKNEFWISSDNEGIEVLALPSFTFKKKINKYNSIATNKINTIFKDKNNFVYIPSNKGFYRYDALATTTKKPKIHFENLFVNNRNVDSLLQTSEKIILSNSENNITVNFKTVNIKNPNKIKYRFKLNNSFSHWSPNHQIQFANLNYGNYTLSIQSKIDNDLSSIKSISFKISTPVYMEVWFIILIITILLFIVAIYLHFYIKNIEKINNNKVQKLKQEKYLINLEQKALQLQMNPHFIFNVLNGIKALGNSNKIDEMNESISLFSSLLRNILQNSMKEDISLNEEIISLKSYLELEKRMNTVVFDYTIHSQLNNIDPQEIIIPPMLIQPFIENSIKHGFIKKEKYHIKIDFIIEKQDLKVVILDDGVGLNHAKKEGKKTSHKSVAVQLTKERIQNISKRNYFLIQELKEKEIVKGTKVSFKLPLITDF